MPDLFNKYTNKLIISSWSNVHQSKTHCTIDTLEELSRVLLFYCISKYIRDIIFLNTFLNIKEPTLKRIVILLVKHLWILVNNGLKNRNQLTENKYFKIQSYVFCNNTCISKLTNSILQTKHKTKHTIIWVPF